MSKSISISNPDSVVSLVIEPYGTGDKIGGNLDLSIFTNATNIDVSDLDILGLGTLPTNSLITFDASNNKIGNLDDLVVGGTVRTFNLKKNRLSDTDIDRVLSQFDSDVMVNYGSLIDVSGIGNSLVDDDNRAKIVQLQNNNWTVNYNNYQYAILADSTQVEEGASIGVEISTTAYNVPDGTSVPYTISGVQPNDIDQNIIGSFLVVNNKAFKNFNIRTDLGITAYEESESFTLTLDPSLGAISVTVPIIDNTPAPFYLTAETGFAEGVSVNIRIDALNSNIPDGTQVPYTIYGDIDSADIQEALSGVFVINNNTDVISINAIADNIAEGVSGANFTGTEVLSIKLNDYPTVYKDINLFDTTFELKITQDDPASVSFANLTNLSSVNEGESFIAVLKTEGLVNGSVPYRIEGISASDIAEDLAGDFSLINNIATKTFNVINDFQTDGDDIFTLLLVNGFATASVQIGDTSLDPTLDLTTDPLNTTSTDEGTTLTIKLETTGLPENAVINYTLSNTIQSADFTASGFDGGAAPADLKGSFTIDANGEDTVTFELAEDATTEGTQTLTLNLDDYSDFISVDISDTSLTPTFALSTTASTSGSPALPTVDEDTTFNITLTTQNVIANTNIPYTITGIQAADITGSLTGYFTIAANGTATETITTDPDNLTDGEEILKLKLNGLSEFIDIRISDTSTSVFALESTVNGNVSSTGAEGDEVEFTLTTNQTNGPYSYIVNGVETSGTFFTEDDFVAGTGLTTSLTGSFAGDGDTVKYKLKEDNLTEGPLFMIMSLNDVDGDGNPEASDSVIINDSSIETYSLTSSQQTVAEGGSTTITLTTQGVPDNTLVPYTIDGTGITTDDFVGLSSLQGDFTVIGDTASVTFNIALDALSENATETFTLALDNEAASIDVDITNVVFTLRTNASSVNEGQSFTVTLTAPGVLDNSSVFYTMSGGGSELETVFPSQVVVSNLTTPYAVYNGTYVYDSTEDVWYNNTNTDATTGNNGYFSYSDTRQRWQWAPDYSDAKNWHGTRTAYLVTAKSVGFWEVDNNPSWINVGAAVLRSMIFDSSFASASSSRTPGPYTSIAASGGSGTGATFDVSVDSNGRPTVTVSSAGTGYIVGEQFTIADSLLGGGGADPLTFNVGTLKSAITLADFADLPQDERETPYGIDLRYFTVVNGTAVHTFEVANDFTTESGIETFVLTLNDFDLSVTVDIVDSSTDPTISFAINRSVVNERGGDGTGGYFEAVATTTGIPDNTLVPYTITGTGITSDDFDELIDPPENAFRGYSSVYEHVGPYFGNGTDDPQSQYAQSQLDHPGSWIPSSRDSRTYTTVIDFDDTEATLDVSALQNSEDRYNIDSSQRNHMTTVGTSDPEPIVITLNNHTLSTGDEIRMTINADFAGPIAEGSDYQTTLSMFVTEIQTESILAGFITQTTTNTFTVQLYNTSSYRGTFSEQIQYRHNEQLPSIEKGWYKSLDEMPLGTDQTAIPSNGMRLEKTDQIGLNEWIELATLTREITGITTQGRTGEWHDFSDGALLSLTGEAWVKTYKVQYRDHLPHDGITALEWAEAGNSEWSHNNTTTDVGFFGLGHRWFDVDDGRIFDGNVDGNSKVTNTFNTPVVAVELRIIPLTYYRQPAMRVAAVTEVLVNNSTASTLRIFDNEGRKHFKVRRDQTTEGSETIIFTLNDTNIPAPHNSDSVLVLDGSVDPLDQPLRLLHVSRQSSTRNPSTFPFPPRSVDINEGFKTASYVYPPDHTLTDLTSTIGDYVPPVYPSVGNIHYSETVLNPSESDRSYSSTAFSSGDYDQSMLDSVRAWSSSNYMPGDDWILPASRDEWVQIDLGANKTISGVVTQGKNSTYADDLNSGDQWTISYRVTHSSDGTNFSFVDYGHVFTGNTDGNTKVTNTFSTSVLARYIRIYPYTYFGYPSMRAGVVENTSSPLTLREPFNQNSDYFDSIIDPSRSFTRYSGGHSGLTYSETTSSDVYDVLIFNNHNWLDHNLYSLRQIDDNGNPITPNTIGFNQHPPGIMRPDAVTMDLLKDFVTGGGTIVEYADKSNFRDYGHPYAGYGRQPSSYAAFVSQIIYDLGGIIGANNGWKGYNNYSTRTAQPTSWAIGNVSPSLTTQVTYGPGTIYNSRSNGEAVLSDQGSTSESIVHLWDGESGHLNPDVKGKIIWLGDPSLQGSTSTETDNFVNGLTTPLLDYISTNRVTQSIY